MSISKSQFITYVMNRRYEICLKHYEILCVFTQQHSAAMYVIIKYTNRKIMRPAELIVVALLRTRIEVIE